MQLTIPAGTGVLLGAPAQPMDSSLIRSLTSLVASFPGVQEAHLPQCWVQSTMREPAQVLVMVFSAHSEETAEVVRRMETALCPLLSRNRHLDVWFMAPGDSLLEAVRNTGCKIYEKPVCQAVISPA